MHTGSSYSPVGVVDASTTAGADTYKEVGIGRHHRRGLHRGRPCRRRWPEQHIADVVLVIKALPVGRRRPPDPISWSRNRKTPAESRIRGNERSEKTQGGRYLMASSGRVGHAQRPDSAGPHVLRSSRPTCAPDSPGSRDYR